MSAVGIAQSAVLGGDPGAWGVGLGLVTLGLLLAGTAVIRNRRQRVTEAGDREAARLAGRVYRSHRSGVRRLRVAVDSRAAGWIAAGVLALAGVGLLAGAVWAGLALIAPEVLP